MNRRRRPRAGVWVENGVPHSWGAQKIIIIHLTYDSAYTIIILSREVNIVQIILKKQAQKYLDSVDDNTRQKLYKALDHLSRWEGDIVRKTLIDTR